MLPRAAAHGLPQILLRRNAAFLLADSPIVPHGPLNVSIFLTIAPQIKTQAHTHTHTHARTRTHARAHTHARTHAHAHAHAYTLDKNWIIEVIRWELNPIMCNSTRYIVVNDQNIYIYIQIDRLWWPPGAT